MSANKALAREQALDDYFDALLAEAEETVIEGEALAEELVIHHSELEQEIDVVADDDILLSDPFLSDEIADERGSSEELSIELTEPNDALDFSKDSTGDLGEIPETGPEYPESGEFPQYVEETIIETPEACDDESQETIVDAGLADAAELAEVEEPVIANGPDMAIPDDSVSHLHVVDDGGEIQGWDLEDDGEELSSYPLEQEPEPQLQITPKVDEPVRVPLYKSEADLSHIEALLAQLKTQDAVEEESVTVVAEPEAETVTEEVILEPEIDTVEETTVSAEAESEQGTESTVEDATETSPETQAAGDHLPPEDWSNIDYGERFQVLFFESWGVTYAVPLAELGGIHKLEELNHLIGRPDWYMGLQSNREMKFDVVDTAKWVMNDKISDDDHRESYSYIVVLGNSRWSLACDTLIGTETVESVQVRWRETAGKRPWLAGMVKEKMCALIHVEALVALLDKGIDAKQLA
ncbi:chemotaxis protein CheW [Parasalinivibrio latis]|uniref:chemotaxis protein CheW n=1 Tax=Parasalinivibrio latis TaxID=2952610 RepID=UPI0030E1AFE2